MKQLKALVCATALAVPMAALPVSAQGPIAVGNLVNVQVVNVANNNEIIKNVNVAIGGAIAIAANVCDTTVQLLTVEIGQKKDYTCTSSTGDQRVDITQR